MQPSIGAQLNRASSPIRQRLRSGKRYVVDLHWDSLNNLSDCTVEELTRYIEELGNPLRSDSFSSIATVSAREDFETAIDNIKQGIFLFGFPTVPTLFQLLPPPRRFERVRKCTNSRGKNFKTTTSRAVMDSPSDLSPNAPPSGFDESNNYFSNLQAPPAPPSSSSTGQASTEGSVDSSGFEKVDHDVLEEYGQQFVNEMQQSLFGKPLEADSSKQDMSSGPRDDVLEKSYGGDLIDIPKNETYPDQAKLTAGDHPTEDTKQASNTMHSFDLLGDVVPEVHDTKSVPTERSHGTGTHDHFHHDDAPFEPVGRGGVPLDQLIEDQVAEVHGDVDEVLHRMQETDEFKHNVEKKEEHVEKKEERHIPEDSDSDHPDFRSQTPEVEESTFNRRGPLTIPEVSEKVPGDDLLEDDHQHDRFGFEKEPRPPTPPKDISEESVKPSAFSLAHGTGSSPSHPDVLHPILKHGGSQSAEPWTQSSDEWMCSVRATDPEVWAQLRATMSVFNEDTGNLVKQ
ncbi:hypothetical protein RB195_014281 [Necator americanus]|uniref:Uncharacterized protein n=1 Tax=Necator americanus TaxID=51031 RepID=A0ABR1E0Z1_NECAM